MSFGAGYSAGPAESGKKLVDLSLKRLFDITAALMALVLLSPLFLLVALAVFMLEGGPVIYRHRRLTLDGKGFDCLKFRSMVSNADKILKLHLDQNEDAASQWAENQKLTRDPRVTAFGAFLRKSSLDELPQLINVVRGDMSLVGPRPIVLDELRRYGEHADEYLSVRPGLTGPWQINGRSDCPYADRVRLDLEYIRGWTFTRDLMIVA